MTPHKQLFQHRPADGVFGDCYRTCIASLLDLDHPSEAPHEHRTFADGEMRQFMEAWLRPRGYATAFLAFDADPEAMLAVMKVANPGMLYLLSGLSRTGCNHVVICRDDQIIHDPSLTDAGIVGRCDDGHTYIEWLVPTLMLATMNTPEQPTPAVPVADYESRKRESAAEGEAEHLNQRPPPSGDGP